MRTTILDFGTESEARTAGAEILVGEGLRLKDVSIYTSSKNKWHLALKNVTVEDARWSLGYFVELRANDFMKNSVLGAAALRTVEKYKQRIKSCTI